MEHIRYITIGLMLAVQSYFDFRYKKIPSILTFLGGAIGALLLLFEGIQPEEWCYGFLPGVICLLYAKLSKEAIGYGDGMILCAMACGLRGEESIRIGMYAFTLASVVALMLLFIGKKSRKYELAFVPFLGLAYLFEMGCIYVEKS